MGSIFAPQSFKWEYPALPGLEETPPELFHKPGRFPEHHAKEILRTYGLDVPQFMWAETPDQAVRFADRIGYPVVAKVISPDVYCKSDRGGIETRIIDEKELRKVFDRFRRTRGFKGILVEERLDRGLELNIGAAKVDFRYGPAVFLERVHSFGDQRGNRTFRLPTGGGWNLTAMLREIGLLPYHGKPGAVAGINIVELERLLSKTAELVMDPLAGMEAIILDPVRCVNDRCVVLDARIKFSRDQQQPGGKGVSTH